MTTELAGVREHPVSQRQWTAADTPGRTESASNHPHTLKYLIELALIVNGVLRCGVLLGDGSPRVGTTGRRQVAGLHGMVGMGRIVLAAKLAHATAVRAAFPNGIFYPRGAKKEGREEQEDPMPTAG